MSTSIARFAPALLLVLAALPFDPSWPDAEVARRGLLLCLCGAVVAFARRWWPAELPRGSVLLGCLCGWFLLRSIGATNPVEGLHRGAYLVALAALFVWGSRQAPERVLAAIVPAALAVAAYGVLQALGLDWPAGYARPSEPVSTLGNRNVASEFAALGAAALAVLVVRTPRPAVLAAAFGLAAVYLGVNGSRSGLLAMALASITALGFGARDRKVLRAGLLIACLGAAAAADRDVRAWLGSDAAANTAPDAAEPTAPGAHGQLEHPAASTIAVRLALWESCLAMIRDEPLLGHGPGQFRYEYPRYRSQEEIELSTMGRRFRTSAATAHDDFLELAVEGGVPALLTFLTFLLVVLAPHLRGRRSRAELAPVVAMLALMLVRSPLGNAPAAAFTFVYLGALAGADAPVGTAQPRGRWPWLLALFLGAALLLAGIGPLVAQSAAAAWLRGATIEALDRAVAWHGSESRHRSLRIVARCGGVDRNGRLVEKGPEQYERSQADLIALARLDPNNTTALFLSADLAWAAGDVRAAHAALVPILQLDPRDPLATLLAAVLLCQSGDVPRGIATLYADPHPRLRDGLAKHLGDLEGAVRTAGDADGALLLDREARFVRALDQLLARPGSALADAAVTLYARAAGSSDLRGRILIARQLQAKGSPQDLLNAARLVPGNGVDELGGAQQRLLAPVLAELEALDAWRDWLDPR